MGLGRILILLAWVPAAQAQLPQGQPVSDPPDGMVLRLPFSMKLRMEVAPSVQPSPGIPSAVFTPDYWSREYAERAQLENRFGIHLMDRSFLQPTLVQQTPVPGHSQFNFVQELRWPGGQPLTGLQFERRDLLFRGDRFSVRATSDLQTLIRGVGLAGSDAEVGVLSMLGWRSHSHMVWELGEPTHELHWQVSAGFDRRANVESSNIQLQLLRRF